MGLDDWSELAQASSLCGACRDVCPAGIDLPHLLLKLREQAARRELAPLWLRLAMPFYAAIATRPALYQRLGAIAARIARAAYEDGWIRRLPGPFAAWTASRDLPAPVPRSFVQQHRADKAGTGALSS
jgi:L-lactate dehydrogenase complex protein LldF